MLDNLLTQWNSLLDELPTILANLQFLRPDWFYAFIPLLVFILLSYRTTSNNKNWKSVVDPALLPFVLTSTSSKKRRYPLLLTLIAGSLCITALAGPVYKKLPQPVYREQSSLVILLDLSQSMNATDIKPSRLARAKLELLDLLKTRRSGQTALIVYAADAFVVTPLTDDNATIANLIPSLETDMMPAQGSNLASALSKTFALFTQAGIINGDILVVTDGIRSRSMSSIEKVVSQGHRLSILGIGTAAGGPIPLTGEGQSGFLLDKDGAIVIPKLDTQTLNRLASEGGGIYTSLYADDSDTEKLNLLLRRTDLNESDEVSDINADRWREEGFWLLLPLLLFAALWARRGWIVVTLFLLSPTLAMLPSPAYADESSSGIDLENLWFSADQKAMKAFNKGDTKSAAEQFTSPEWKASALYKNGDFDAAAKTLDGIDNSDALYNKGNALARKGKYDEAIKAYDQALELDPMNQDASYNREQVRKALQQQEQQDQKQDGEPSDESEKGDDSQQQDSEQQGKPDAENEQQDGKQQQNSEQQGEPNPENEQQDSEQQQNPEQQGEPDPENADKADTQKPEGQESAQQDEELKQEELKQRDAEAEAEQQEQEQQEFEKQDQESSQAEQADDEKTADEQNKSDEVEHKDGDDKPAEIEINPMEASITEEEKATEQWLKRIPDDPGGLLRRKFYYQYKHIPNQNDTDEPW